MGVTKVGVRSNGRGFVDVAEAQRGRAARGVATPLFGAGDDEFPARVRLELLVVEGVDRGDVVVGLKGKGM